MPFIAVFSCLKVAVSDVEMRVLLRVSALVGFVTRALD